MRPLAAMALLLVACRSTPKDAPAIENGFVCMGDECVQAHPRLPGDGEWTCADDVGVTVCVGGEPAAGVAPSDRESEWTCGARVITHDDLSGSQVCVDPSPDFPGGHASGFRCFFRHSPRTSRVCVRDANVHVAGDFCDHDRPCVDGTSCVESRCVAPRRTPNCAFDTDCASSSCRFGACK